MPRSIWSGSISFALINIPVKLYTAVSPKDVHFHQVHDTDGVRIQQKRICPKDGKEVPYEHIVKGYEISPNRYVIVKPEELEALDPKGSHTIEIQSFAGLDQIDPLYYENSYYLVPDKGAAKSYALFLRAMGESKKVAIAKFVMRSRQYLGLLRPTGRALTLSTMFYYDEVVPESSLEELQEDVRVDEKELKMARQLIDSLTEDFKPTRYHDEYRERVLHMIELKSQGKELVAQPAEPEHAKVVSLMAALQASLASTKKAQAREKSETHREHARKRKQKTA